MIDRLCFIYIDRDIIPDGFARQKIPVRLQVRTDDREVPPAIAFLPGQLLHPDTDLADLFARIRRFCQTDGLRPVSLIRPPAVSVQVLLQMGQGRIGLKPPGHRPVHIQVSAVRDSFLQADPDNIPDRLAAQIEKSLPAARAAAVHQFLRPQASVIRQCNTEDDFPGTGHQGGQDPVLDGRKAGKTIKYDDAAADQL